MKINKIFSYLIVVTLFLSSFLLFLIQPLIGKFLLPYFGGNSFVWIISVSFFTSFLFLSYFYAFLLAKIKLKKQIIFHFLLLIIVSFFHFYNSIRNNWLSPIFPNNLETGQISVYFVLFTLFISIGLLFLILASTNTILQNWYGQINQKKSPYYLYAVSNVGSILGLFSYPLFFEIFYGNIKQSNIWSALYLLYLFLFILIISFSLKLIKNRKIYQEKIYEKSLAFFKLPLFYWFINASLPVIFYLVISDNLSRGVASFPLIWILPLFSYLLSFVFAFKVSFKKIKPEIIAFILLIFTFNYIFKSSISSDLFFSVFVNNILVFLVSLLCHANLYDSRPENIKYLPSFYLFISLGGALGSIFVSLLVPVIFNNYYELPIAILIFLLIIFYFLIKNRVNILKYFTQKYKVILYISTFWLLIINFAVNINDFYLLSKENTTRGYFGVLKLIDSFRNVDNNFYRIKTIYHGGISHGHEVIDHKNSGRTSYYSEISGLGISLNYLKSKNESIKTAMIGLGAGMTADYNREDDKMVFYEIDQNVIDLANNEFNYLSQAKGEVELKLGDARLVLDDEKKDNIYDLIAIDAFSDNAIPVHLLTYEAFKIYQNKTKEDGIIVYHISNRYLDIDKILTPICYELKLECVLIRNNTIAEKFISTSSWFLMTKNKEFIDFLRNYEATNTRFDFIDKNKKPALNYFTDDFNNIISILRF